MQKSKSLTQTACALAMALAILHPGHAGETNQEGWIPLFNGKDLDGWTPKISGYEAGENPGDIFRIEDGLLRVSYDQFDAFEGRFGHLFYKDKLSNYHLRAVYRFVGEQSPGGPGWAFRNNGIMLHCQSPQSMGLKQNFPDSIEAQVLGGDGKKDRPTGSLFTPGTYVMIDGKKMPGSRKSQGKTYHGDPWVTLELIVDGDQITHIINGETVMTYEKPHRDDGTPLHEGYIAIQAESHGTDFKTIEYRPLR
jgi:hypothetical protein